MFGARGIAWASHRDFKVVDQLFNVDEEGYEEISRVAEDALNLYSNGEISSIDIIYTRYINPVKFEPVKVTLLPVSQSEEDTKEKEHIETIFEPSGSEILDNLVPMYLKSLLYSYWLETKTSEQASRRVAMESATDNAEELKAELELEFNKARQAAITQEITEIVGGANAL